MNKILKKRKELLLILYKVQRFMIFGLINLFDKILLFTLINYYIFIFSIQSEKMNKVKRFFADFDLFAALPTLRAK